MNVQRLDHMNLTVLNLNDSVSWYRNLFGFEVKEEGDSRGEPWAILQSGEASLCLYQRPGFQTHDPDRDYSDMRLTMNHFAFSIANEEDWLEAVEKNNPHILYGGAVTEYPNSRSWYVIDPNGFHIEVCIWNSGKPEF